MIQVVEKVLYYYDQDGDRTPYYEALEKIYGIELHHFKRPHEEL